MTQRTPGYQLPVGAFPSDHAFGARVVLGTAVESAWRCERSGVVGTGLAWGPTAAAAQATEVAAVDRVAVDRAAADRVVRDRALITPSTTAVVAAVPAAVVERVGNGPVKASATTTGLTAKQQFHPSTASGWGT
ncbi:hypothetical protein [Actinokineospora inagensis]|uniref:hypothetical protein n=1 Tax=Actinokineospora inagensis TaxID=103730 RepID=UPI0012FB4B57|nr:hypothetical protein [Actinokineospora inagensis]